MRARFDFEDLVVFRRALDLLEATDRLVYSFEGHRRKLAFNMFDAAGSVVYNIAESRGRKTTADRAHFLDVANGSAHETGAGACIAEHLRIGSPEARARVRTLSLEVIAMLTTMTARIRTPTRRP